MSPAPTVSRAVLEELARRYEARRAGRTGLGKQRVLFDFEEILSAANSAEGNARDDAVEQLTIAERQGWLKILKHPRDKTLHAEIEFLPEGEEPIFRAVNQLSPTARRKEWQRIFAEASQHRVPDAWMERWQAWCHDLGRSAAFGEVKAPFLWKELSAAEELLRVLAGVLSWPGESLIRFVSCVLCGTSKRLEELAPRLVTALRELSHGEVTDLEQLGVLRVPRVVLLHGPLILELPGGNLDLGLLQAPAWISEADIQAARSLIVHAPRCLTVENETTLQELAKLQSGTLLIHTSYPTSGVLTLLKKLPAAIPCWHFGDTDPFGFDVLRILRRETGRSIAPLHMRFRPSSKVQNWSSKETGMMKTLLADELMTDVREELLRMQGNPSKGDFEQENYGIPQKAWPFY